MKHHLDDDAVTTPGREPPDRAQPTSSRPSQHPGKARRTGFAETPSDRLSITICRGMGAVKQMSAPDHLGGIDQAGRPYRDRTCQNDVDS